MDVVEIGSVPHNETWPARGLNVEVLRQSGWKPSPFSQFIVKIHSRCNLACRYCYMYEAVDQSWRLQPKVMSEAVYVDACRAIGEHCKHFAIPAVSVVFHGGEPLLAGHEKLRFYARHVSESVAPETRVRLGIQTNGLLLDDEFLDIFDQWRVQVAVSLDGTRDGHDRHRRFRDGSGSYEDVVEGLSRLLTAERRHLFAGLLCTVDLQNDPVETFESLAAFEPPAIDFLLPHGNWQIPPPGRTPDPEATPYGDWLVAAFDRWYGAERLETRVRLFEQIIDLLLGGSGVSESVGLAPVKLAVIETDGSLEQVDALKTAFEGATKLSPDGVGNPLDLALWQPSIVARQIGVDALCSTCRQCALRDVCGGGNYTHRYHAQTGFLNPSVYCADLAKLISHIQQRLAGELNTLTGRRI